MVAGAQKPENAALLEGGWAALPAAYRIPDVAPTLDEARAYCRRLTESHYENFHVASWFLPKALRPHFHAIYAFCRVSDDLGDEVGNPLQSLALLGEWRRELDACYEGHARHPVFVALRETIRACSIPREPFADLLTAFCRDQTVTRYSSRAELMEYCRYSAAPVGRLVLYASGEADEARFALSDATCSALQLANFWQDIGRDFAMGRIYLPQDQMARFGVTERDIATRNASPEFRAMLQSEVQFARGLFEEGLPLIGMVRRDLALDLELFSSGGMEILSAIERLDFDVLALRPALSKGTKLKLALRAAAGKALPFSRLGLRMKSRKP